MALSAACLTLNRLSDSTFWGPSEIVYPTVSSPAHDVVSGRPFRNASRFTVNGGNYVVSFIATLLSFGSPSAIRWFVAPVVINPINAGPFGSWPHILCKLSKAIEPFRANGYSSAAVIRKGFAFGVGAPIFDISPNTIHGSTGAAMNKPAFGKQFALQASARLNLACAQVPCANFKRLSAIADAEPVVVVATLLGKLNNSQATNTKTGSINKSRHILTSIMVNNHWMMRSNEVIEFSLSAAKPSYAKLF